MFYYGILDGKDDVWGVRIPDLPGCHGGGSTPEAAMSDAMSAASTWLSGDDAPEPSIMAKISTQVGTSEALVIIPVETDSGKTVRANITIDSGLLADIDRASKIHGLSRSGFIAKAAREKITSLVA